MMGYIFHESIMFDRGMMRTIMDLMYQYTWSHIFGKIGSVDADIILLKTEKDICDSFKAGVIV